MLQNFDTVNPSEKNGFRTASFPGMREDGIVYGALPPARRKWQDVRPHYRGQRAICNGLCLTAGAFHNKEVRVPHTLVSGKWMSLWLGKPHENDPSSSKGGTDRWRQGALPSINSGGNGPPNHCQEFLQVEEVGYRPPGTELDLLKHVSFSLPEKSLGLVYGRSGSGKTTLLQVLAGLATPTEGSIYIGKDSSQRKLSARVGIVFQFPERYFLADSVLEELTFGWPRRVDDPLMRQQLAMRLQAAIFAVGLGEIPLDTNPRALSDGYKRRLALAVQLVRMPDLLLLDEPLAGLDWKARTDVVRLLWSLKRERTLVVVSHDLKELAPLVDRAWQMEMGGCLTEQPWPPRNLTPC